MTGPMHLITIIVAALMCSYVAAAPSPLVSEVESSTLVRRYDAKCIDEVLGAGSKASLAGALHCKDRLLSGDLKDKLIGTYGLIPRLVCEHGDTMVTIQRANDTPVLVGSQGSDIGLAVQWTLDHCTSLQEFTTGVEIVTGGRQAANGNGGLIVVTRMKIGAPYPPAVITDRN